VCLNVALTGTFLTTFFFIFIFFFYEERKAILCSLFLPRNFCRLLSRSRVLEKLIVSHLSTFGNKALDIELNS
jgi:hypothetical protein